MMVVVFRRKSLTWERVKRNAQQHTSIQIKKQFERQVKVTYQQRPNCLYMVDLTWVIINHTLPHTHSHWPILTHIQPKKRSHPPTPSQKKGHTHPYTAKKGQTHPHLAKKRSHPPTPSHKKGHTHPHPAKKRSYPPKSSRKAMEKKIFS